MGENRIKLVAADMDGTLLNRERKITKYTQNVIKKAMAQGVYFVPATGRAADALSKIEDIQFSSSLPKNLEISKKGCNKGDGLFHLAKILNIQKEEIMSCGDADNDRELLESAGLAVVMENGLDSMKAIADYITVSNQENGVAKAMEKFVLR